jgi:hypothetical protein
MKNSIKLVFALILVLSFSCETEPVIDSELIQNKDEMLSRSSNVKTTVDAFSPILGRVTGSSTLHRTKNGITYNYSTNALRPGHAYTLWVVVWNNPGNCDMPNACVGEDFANAASVGVDLLYGGGHVVGNNGKGNFSGHLNVDDVSDSVYELFGLPQALGLQSGKTFSSEIHLVIRSHGPAVPGLVNEQIGSYLGGCDNQFATPPFLMTPDEIGECGDIEAAIHAPIGS